MPGHKMTKRFLIRYICMCVCVSVCGEGEAGVSRGGQRWKLGKSTIMPTLKIFSKKYK